MARRSAVPFQEGMGVFIGKTGILLDAGEKRGEKRTAVPYLGKWPFFG